MKTFVRIKTFSLGHKKELLLVILLLTICGVAHAWNMFKFPYFENDEATYISQATSFMNHGRLSPYTYYYDHVPGGWILMAAWLMLTVKTHLLTSALVSGRLFMLLVHLLSAALLYLIARKITKSKIASTATVLLYSLSPLVIYFQRRILLDNIMHLWVLMSLALILYSNNRLKYYLLSGLAFALALLSKESALPFVVPLLYAVYSTAHIKQRKHALAQWLGVAVVTCSLYLLYGFLRGELFPAHTLLGGNNEHVSLLGTLKDQSSRGVFHFPWDKRSDFYINLKEWIMRDAVIIYGGLAALLASCVLAIWKRRYVLPALLSLVTLLFLARGKLVIDFYVVPMLPFLALNIGMVFGDLTKLLKPKVLGSALLILLFIPICIYYARHDNGLHRHDEVTEQYRAQEWIGANVSSSSKVAIDNYAYPYLHDQKNFKNADYVFKLQYDKEISKKISNDWRNIDYILLTHEVVKQIKIGSLPVIKSALEHSQLVADFSENSTSYIDLKNYISTNGDWAQVYKVKSASDVILQDSWQKYRQNNIESYGQVVDHSQTPETTTSEGQAYALLRAVQMNDKQSFEGVLSWSKDHMQHRQNDKLFSWKWQKINNTWRQIDANGATDADEDIATALLKAEKKWPGNNYLKQAKEIINDIWAYEIITINSKYYVMSSPTKPNEGEDTLLNPSYIAPDYYKSFALIDSAHPWMKLVDDSYEFLNRVQNKSTGLVGDWVQINAVGQIVPLTRVGLSPNFGYDAFRTAVRVSQDIEDVRSQAYLKTIASFYKNAWKPNKAIYAVYDLEGMPLVNYGDVAPYGAAAIVLNVSGNKDLANIIYSSQIQNKYHEGIWGDSKNYYNQNWAWFTTSNLR
jgi:endo-1,4-beta-D-glucanase Y